MNFYRTGEHRVPKVGEYSEGYKYSDTILKWEQISHLHVQPHFIVLPEPKLPSPLYSIFSYNIPVDGDLYLADGDVVLLYKKGLPNIADRHWIVKFAPKMPIPVGYEYTGEYRRATPEEVYITSSGRLMSSIERSRYNYFILKEKAIQGPLNITKSDKTIVNKNTNDNSLVYNNVVIYSSTLNWSH